MSVQVQASLQLNPCEQMQAQFGVLAHAARVPERRVQELVGATPISISGTDVM